MVILYIWCPQGIVAFEVEAGVYESYDDANFHSVPQRFKYFASSVIFEFFSVIMESVIEINAKLGVQNLLTMLYISEAILLLDKGKMSEFFLLISLNISD